MKFLLFKKIFKKENFRFLGYFFFKENFAMKILYFFAFYEIFKIKIL